MNRLIMLLLPLTAAAQLPGVPPRTLPAEATAQLAENLEASAGHVAHAWHDTPPFNDDGTVNAYIEIPRGAHNKWELDMRNNNRVIDRVIPELVGPYPVNYGFVPQTVFYDGDPFDALVLGPAIEGGTTIRGAIVGLMFMRDEKGLDSKVVLSPLDEAGRPLHTLSDAEKRLIGDYFDSYKRLDPGRFSDVPGWGSMAEGRAHVDIAHAFFTRCARAAGACTLDAEGAPTPAPDRASRRRP